MKSIFGSSSQESAAHQQGIDNTATIVLHQDGDTDQAVVTVFVFDYRDNQRPRSLRHKLIATC